MSKSLEFQKHALTIIPGMTQLLSKRPDMFSFGVWPGYFDNAKGSIVCDLDGIEYLDMSIGGIGACVLGYADPEVDNAVIANIKKGVASSLNCPEEVELADLLCQIHPWAQMARFTRSGGEALSLAVRLARATTEKDIVAFCGYHGWNDWYLAANLAEDKALDGHLLPGLAPTGVPRILKGTCFPFRYNHSEELELIANMNKGKLAAIIMEPIRSDEPQPGFIEKVREIADNEGAILIMDEVSAGFRFCAGGAHLVKHKVYPDMAVFSKALGNGYAISAVIGRECVMQNAQKTFISSTNWTERIGPTAALATIRKYMRVEPFKKFTTFGQCIKKGWIKLGEKYGFDLHVEGMDAMSHFVINIPNFLYYKAYFIQLMLQDRILASNLCYLMDSHTESDIQRYLYSCDNAFAKMAEARDKGDIKSRLIGAPSTSGFKRLA